MFSVKIFVVGCLLFIGIISFIVSVALKIHGKKLAKNCGAKPAEEKPKEKLSDEAQKEADARREAANQKLNDLLKK